MPALPAIPNSPAALNDIMQLPPSVPQLPDDVVKRFASMGDWQEELAAWYKAIVISLQDQVSDTSDNVTQQNSDANANALNVRGLTSAVIMISAIAGKASGITVSDIAPGAPAVGDVWVNTTDPTNVITYQWDGSNWVVLTQPIAFAAVAQEQAARITADGFLSGKYTLTVVAGNVVTGMNITSSTGGGTNISQVIFEADKFQIYSGTTGQTMFVTDAINHTVALAGVLIVNSASNKVYIGAGNYGNADTAWYVDSTGIMSLKDKLTWDGTTLTITGVINASSGTIGGFTLGATTLTAGSLDSFIQITSDPLGKGYGIQQGETGSLHAYSQLDLTGLHAAFPGFGGDNKLAFSLRTDTVLPGAGILELGVNNVVARRITMRGDTGLVDALGFTVAGVAGETATFDPTTLTSMTFTGGILTAHS